MAFTVAGCASRPDETYVRQLEAVESAYIAGEITKAEYLQMKNEAENASIQRKQMRQLNSTTYNAGRQKSGYQSTRDEIKRLNNLDYVR